MLDRTVGNVQQTIATNAGIRERLRSRELIQEESKNGNEETTNNDDNSHDLESATDLKFELVNMEEGVRRQRNEISASNIANDSLVPETNIEVKYQVESVSLIFVTNTSRQLTKKKYNRT